MKITVEKILSYRSIYNRKCYIVKIDEDNYYVVYGTQSREVTPEDSHLYTKIKRFEGGHIKWEQVSGSVSLDRDEKVSGEKSKWNPIDKSRSLYVESVVADGESIEFQ